MSELQRIPVNLKYLRKKAGLTQIKASEIAGISKYYWNWIEKGDRLPSLLILEKMCQAIKAPMSEIFEKPDNHV